MKDRIVRSVDKFISSIVSMKYNVVNSRKMCIKLCCICWNVNFRKEIWKHIFQTFTIL